MEEFEIRNGILEKYHGTGGDAVIPYGTKTIAMCAFCGCIGLTSVTIPDSVTRVGAKAFDGCTGLTSVTIPDSVTSIGGYAFADCTGLRSVAVPDSVTNYWGRAFTGCTALGSVTVRGIRFDRETLQMLWNQQEIDPDEIIETLVTYDNARFHIQYHTNLLSIY